MSDSTFLVVMDCLGVKEGGMPRQFYRALGKLGDVARLQKSVYMVTGVTALKDLVNLGRGCGFSVQAFQVVKNGHDLTSEKK